MFVCKSAGGLRLWVGVCTIISAGLRCVAILKIKRFRMAFNHTEHSPLCLNLFLTVEGVTIKLYCTEFLLFLHKTLCIMIFIIFFYCFTVSA